MRRAVWAEGVESLPQAVDYVNGLIAEQIRARKVGNRGVEARVLDIGCGVGGSLIFLAGAVGAAFRGTGVTISPHQAEIARRQARKRGLSSKLSFLAADFTAASALSDIHLAFAIESFVHFPTPETFFSAAARSLSPGGRLVLVDDFLSGKNLSRNEGMLVDAFRYGWLLSSLCSTNRAAQAAESQGMRLVEDRDMSSCLAAVSLGPRQGDRKSVV
jgi:cyclopropane fatty-acyl-phospholipid synthase-like methyltransferase